MKGHGVYDRGDYRPKEEIEKWLSRDPIVTYGRRLLDGKIMTRKEIDEVDAAAGREIEDAVTYATQSSLLPFQELGKYVYAEG
jgi:TPP-dependent pyruvate/acetoin dehydrogenase alpha subunit